MATTLALWIMVSAGIAFVHGGCNQKHAAKRDEVTYITSPGYPGNFTQHVDCYYELYTTSDNRGLVVFVDVLDVTLSCDDDSIQLHVYDGFSRHPRFLGQICDGGQTTFQSPKQTLYLTFRSRAQHAARSRGFRLRVRTEPKYCHCYKQETMVLDVTSTPSIITSPFYPFGTEANVNCRWLLKAPEDSRVNVSLLNSDMKGSGDCHNFGLYVYDGKTTYDDKLLASVCDNSLRSFQSSGPYLLLVFTSGPMVYRSGGGVKLYYSTLPADGAEDSQLIGQTLFFVITALLVVLILSISLIAALKLFFLPRRRKQAERRRRAARVRLTRVSRDYDSPPSEEPVSQSRSGEPQGHMTSCSRAVSSASGSSAVSISHQWSGLSLSLERLASLYGLKKTRQHRRAYSQRGSSSSSASRGTHGSLCLHSRSAQMPGVIIRIPDYSATCGVRGCCACTGVDLPPSYEEVMAQNAALAGVGQSHTNATPAGEGLIRSGALASEETLLHLTMGEARGPGGLGVAVGQSVALGEALGQSTLAREAGLGQSVLGEALGQSTLAGEAGLGQGALGEALGQSTLAGEALLGQGALGEALGQSTLAREASLGQGVLGEALGQRTLAGEAGLGQGVLGEALGRSTLAGEAGLRQGVLGEALGQSTLAGEALPGQGVLGEAIGQNTQAAEALPGRSVPGEAVGHSTPDEMDTVQSGSEEAVAGQSTLGDVTGQISALREVLGMGNTAWGELRAHSTTEEELTATAGGDACTATASTTAATFPSDSAATQAPGSRGSATEDCGAN